MSCDMAGYRSESHRKNFGTPIARFEKFQSSKDRKIKSDFST